MRCHPLQRGSQIRAGLLQQMRHIIGFEQGAELHRQKRGAPLHDPFCSLLMLGQDLDQLRLGQALVVIRNCLADDGGQAVVGHHLQRRAVETDQFRARCGRLRGGYNAVDILHGLNLLRPSLPQNVAW